MSRKNKTLRAFLHQTQNPTIKQAWDAAWKHAQKTFHARSMQAMEKQLATAQAENEALRVALEDMINQVERDTAMGLSTVTSGCVETALDVLERQSEGGNKT